MKLTLKCVVSITTFNITYNTLRNQFKKNDILLSKVQICEWCEEQCTRLVTLVGNEIEEAKGQRVAALASALGALGARHPAHARTALPSVLRRLAAATPRKQNDKIKSEGSEDVEMMDVSL